MTIAEVASLLGWSRTVVCVDVLGSCLHVAGQLDSAEHETRVAERCLPIADPFMLACVATGDPDFLTRRSPVRVDGAIVAGTNWPAVRSTLGGFTGFGARVAVLPPSEAYRLDVAVSAVVDGFGVVASARGHGLELVHHPDVRPSQNRTWVHRLVEEILYDAFLSSPARAAP